MNKITDLPQSALKTVLNTALSNPNSMTSSELSFARRICLCSLCDWLWVRRGFQEPERCPHCNRRGWNRPLLNALIAADNSTPHKPAQGHKERKLDPTPEGA
jgi:hypothetical protein